MYQFNGAVLGTYWLIDDEFSTLFLGCACTFSILNVFHLSFNMSYSPICIAQLFFHISLHIGLEAALKDKN